MPRRDRYVYLPKVSGDQVHREYRYRDGGILPSIGAIQIEYLECQIHDDINTRVKEIDPID